MSKDVAALRARIRALLTRSDDYGEVIVNLDDVLALVPPAAILIDPTAPETAAALAAALGDVGYPPVKLGNAPDAPSQHYVHDNAAYAAAILLAFIARLRGET